jgi:rubredoxin
MNMEKYECEICGYIYDPNEGDPEGDIKPGISFNDLPDDYLCPVCAAGKEEFSVLE